MELELGKKAKKENPKVVVTVVKKRFPNFLVRKPFLKWYITQKRGKDTEKKNIVKTPHALTMLMYCLDRKRKGR